MILLHAAQALQTVTTVDRWLLIAGATALGIAIALIWAPVAAEAASHHATRRRAVGFAVSALVFVAALPAVFPYDHVLPQPAQSDDHAAVHASHCHDQPGTCADAPVSSGPGQLMSSQPLLTQPALLMVLLLFSLPVLAGLTRLPELRPPMRAV